jgi:hypothetical protein
LANLLSHQNVMSCVRCGLEASKPVSQRHMSIRTLHYWFWNVFYLHCVFLYGAFTSPAGHRPWTCLFLRSCTAGKLRSKFISLATTAFVQLSSYTDGWYIDTVMLFILRVHASLLEFIRAMTSNSLKWNRSSFMRRWSVLWTWPPREQFRIKLRQHSLWWNYTAETLCEEE